MSAYVDSRSILHSFFRRFRLFMLFFLPINIAGAAYLMLATPAYESTAKLLIKFGHDARPDIVSQSDSPGTVDEHHELVQSNVRILTSRDLAESLLSEITLRRAYPKIADKPPAQGSLMDAALKRFSDDLVVKTETDSPIIGVSLFNPDPAIASTMLRRLIDLFITHQSEIYSNPQTIVLRAQADVAYKKLQEADKRLHEYKAEAGIASIDEELTLLLHQRSEIAGYISRRPADGAMAGAVAGMSAAALPGRFPADGGDRFPVLDDLQRHLGELNTKKTELLQTYRPDSEVVQTVQRNIDAEIGAQKGAVRELNEQIASLDRQIAAKDHHKAEYEELMRDVQLNEENYHAAQGRAQAAESDQDLNQRKITQIAVIEQPNLPFKPSRPWKALVLVLCFFMSTAFGLAACILAESSDRTFSLPEQAAAALGVPVIASFAYRKPSKNLRALQLLERNPA